MKPVYRIFLFFTLLSPLCHATHFRGGEIMAAHISGQTYKIKVRLYFDKNYGGGADNFSTITACMGDGNVRDLTRLASQLLPDSTTIIQTFEGNHTYGSSGIFQISVASEARSLNYLNFQNQDAGPAFLWTIIDTQLPNATPVLPYLNFFASARQTFTVDLKPTVADQDSISIRVQRISKPSPGTCGVRMQEHGYLFPNEVSSNGTFKVDPSLKQLIWKAPEVVGTYLYAMVVDEWRNGVKISETYREATINVIDHTGPTVEIPPYESAEYGNLITGMPELTSPEVSMAIEAYPVPTEDFVTVKAYSKTRSIIKLQLIDLSGRIVSETSTSTPEILVQHQFDMRNLPQGVYLIRASNSIDAISQKLLR